MKNLSLGSQGWQAALAKVVLLLVVAGLVALTLIFKADILKGLEDYPIVAVFAICLAGWAAAVLIFKSGNLRLTPFRGKEQVPRWSGNLQSSYPSWRDQYPDAFHVMRMFVIVVLIGAWLLGASSVLGFSGTQTSDFRVAFLWAFAFLSAGFLLGFLFGIPLSPKGTPAPNGAGDQVSPDQGGTNQPSSALSGTDQTVATQSGTGLELIVDWLTKTIVGVSLVEFRTLCTWFKSASVLVAQGIANSSTPGGNAVSIASGIILLFSIVGFLGGYLLTRLFLRRAIKIGGEPIKLLNATFSFNKGTLSADADQIDGESTTPWADRIRAFWRVGKNVDLQNETLLLNWIRQNCPGNTISDLINATELQAFRKKIVADLAIPALPSGQQTAKV